MRIDWDKLLSVRRGVVHCATREEAELFVEEAIKRFPKKNLERKALMRQWDYYYKDRTCYNLNYTIDTSGSTYCHIDFYIENGFNVIRFSDLLFDSGDLGELDCSHEPIEFLFGAEGAIGC